MNVRGTSSNTLFDRALVTSDLVYTNINKRYPDDTKLVFVRQLTWELNRCERLWTQCWSIMPHKFKLSVVFMLEAVNFALLRKSWKPDFLKAYNTRLIPTLRQLEAFYSEHTSVLKRGMADIYSQIDNTFLPDIAKESLFHDNTQDPSRSRQ